MNISKHDLKLILILLAVVVFIAAYAAIYLPLSNKADDCEAKTAALKPTLTQLQDYAAHLDEYKAGIKESKAAISAELAKYPTEVRYEDLVEFSTGLQKTVGINLTALDFNAPELVDTFTTLEADDSAKVTASTDRFAYKTGEIISCDLTYAQMKKMIDAIAAAKGRTSLNTLEVSYNSTTGQLTASVNVEKYFITNDFTYTPTTTPDTTLGRADLFGTAAASSSSSSGASSSSSAG